MEADVSAWRKETSCQIVYPAASSSANNQLTTGLIHPSRQPADSSWQLVSLHAEETAELKDGRGRGTKKSEPEPLKDSSNWAVQSSVSPLMQVHTA
ncbi:Hypothetical predicted protein [Xyrichtys novacula]|uniref:Uncharacterized protein n=1 Tax=Xyrichtys novacula TaxID=13765 RepID=A0AAV1GCU9_XYRNO|nr:Hypothetical predicted protein [Xyrichtys novacula]